ncbi:MAG: hypothetical protein ACD_75C00434G0009 [uncultured bacterium]|nr:MAG: hypothetical protein ACD_75C00434G0009 [uncultured bacterium]
MATEKKNAIEEKPEVKKIDVQDQLENAVKIQVVEEVVPTQGGKDITAEDVKVVDTVVKIKNLSIKLPEEIHRKLKAKCAMDGMSTGNVIKRLIDDYIKVT